ncbi:hypothetical protein NC653_007031 [Populus alba x Populus x berolinensis]|uniref:Uncharacterized protein n=1 Tax=Populus alba x Populus x berolinensis TaxID=444605 RepID=A0AAD6WDU1_9ROSI|nr:hypothetical protein NC653_007031 [Populus alba x Populus x berolinensis]
MLETKRVGVWVRHHPDSRGWGPWLDPSGCWVVSRPKGVGVWVLLCLDPRGLGLSSDPRGLG